MKKRARAEAQNLKKRERDQKCKARAWAYEHTKFEAQAEARSKREQSASRARSKHGCERVHCEHSIRTVIVFTLHTNFPSPVTKSKTNKFAVKHSLPPSHAQTSFTWPKRSLHLLKQYPLHHQTIHPHLLYTALFPIPLSPTIIYRGVAGSARVNLVVWLGQLIWWFGWVN